MRPGGVVLSVGLVVLAALAALTIAGIAPTEVRGADAPATEFSAVRARAHIEAIAQQPHPVGSPAHEDVRAYLLKTLAGMGLAARVQEADAAARAAGIVHAAHVENVIARLPGKTGGPAVLLAAHYDSVARSRGASDDGSGVATLLETARALQAGPPLAHDVLFVFTDGEEIGATGALAFTATELAAEPVGVALNFEARGSRGAVAMYDTSRDNGALLAAVKRVAPRVVATSAMGSLARTLPNDSDATVWKRAGIPTLAFAYVDGLHDYHAYTDSLAALDPRSLQHDGDYALPLARYFADHDLPLPASPAVTYFDVFGRYVVVYGVLASRLLALLTLALFVVVARKAIHAGLVGARGVFVGAWVALGAVVSSILAAALVHLLLRAIVPSFVLFARPLVGTVACVLAGVCGFALALARLFRGAREPAIALGGLALWALLLVVTGAFVPAASFVFQWPVLFALLGALVWLAFPGDADLRVDGVVVLALAPGAFFWSYLAYTLYVMLGPQAPEVVVVPVTLPLLLALPAFARARLPLLRVAMGAGAGALAVAVVGGLAIRTSPDLPRPDTLVYWYEKGAKVAHWTTEAAEHDRYVAQRIPQGALSANAELYDVPPFEITHSSSDEAGEKHATMTVRSRGRCVRLWELSSEPITRLSVNGKPVPDVVRFTPELDAKLVRLSAIGQKPAPWVMEYCGAGEAGFSLDFFSPRGKKVRLRVVAVADGLPGLPLAPRGEGDGYPGNDSDVTEEVHDVGL